MSVFNDCLAAGLAAIRSVAGSSVSYVRGQTTLPVSLAVVGSTRIEQEEDGGTIVSAVTIDFLIAVSELPGLTPAAGDRILKDGVSYEVLPVGDERAFEYSDPDRTTYRIHTKQVA